MALTDDERKLVNTLKASGKSTAEIMRIVARRRAGDAEILPDPTNPSFFQSVGDAYQRRSQDVSVEKGRANAGEITQGEAFLRSVGNAAGFAGDVIGAGLTRLPGVEAGLQAVGQTKPVQDVVASYQEWKAANPRAAENLEATVNIASILPIGYGGGIAVRGATSATRKAGQIAAEGVDAIRSSTDDLIGRSSHLVNPPPTPSKAMGEVLQAKKPLSSRDVDAFKNIDTTDVKTYSELNKRIDDSIGKLSQKVDEALDQDKTVVPLASLVTRSTSGSGRIVERNFVETALEHLAELYQKTADDLGFADVQDVMQKARTSGLTRKEVNDISRLYNQEFGTKAFSKMGDPLTSVNAQAYENIRTGLKDVARAGMGGAEAKATDKIVSSLYNTKKLVQKNVEAVQRLQQRIAERGLLEKAGHFVAKYGDILTGGTLRGLIGGLLPRGAGYKVMNALDLEERLQRNLDIIRDALENGSDDAIINATKALDDIPKGKGGGPDTQGASPLNIAPDDGKSVSRETRSNNRSVSSPTTASKPSTAESISTGNAPLGKEGVSAQRADTSGPFDGEKITLYRGGADGRFLTPNRKLAEEYGSVTEYSIPKNTKLLQVKPQGSNTGRTPEAETFAKQLGYNSLKEAEVETDLWHAPSEKIDAALKDAGYSGFQNGNDVYLLRKPSPSIPKELEPLAEATIRKHMRAGDDVDKIIQKAPETKIASDHFVYGNHTRDVPKNKITFDQHPEGKTIDYWKEKISQGQRPAVLLRKNGEGFTVWDGNHRVAAYKALGIKDIPVVYTDTVKQLTDFYNKVKGKKK